MSQPSTKKQRTDSTEPTYELLYHPGIPGRGEFVRLALEAAGIPYTDVSNSSSEGPAGAYAVLDGTSLESSDGNPPIFALPALRIKHSEGRPPLLIAQTPNILSYLGEHSSMAPSSDLKYIVQQIAMTALDLNNEVHDTHHPISVMSTYEEQKTEALRRTTDFRKSRLPKYFSYFQRNLQANSKSNGGFLVGDHITYADTTVFQVLDGLFFAFPLEMEARKTEFPELLDVFYHKVGAELKEYLESERRLPYSNGVFRHYPELDRQ